MSVCDIKGIIREAHETANKIRLSHKRNGELRALCRLCFGISYSVFRAHELIISDRALLSTKYATNLNTIYRLTHKYIWNEEESGLNPIDIFSTY